METGTTGIQDLNQWSRASMANAASDYRQSIVPLRLPPFDGFAGGIPKIGSRLLRARRLRLPAAFRAAHPDRAPGATKLRGGPTAAVPQNRISINSPSPIRIRTGVARGGGVILEGHVFRTPPPATDRPDAVCRHSARRSYCDVGRGGRRWLRSILNPTIKSLAMSRATPGSTSMADDQVPAGAVDGGEYVDVRRRPPRVESPDRARQRQVDGLGRNRVLLTYGHARASAWY